MRDDSTGAMKMAGLETLVAILDAIPKLDVLLNSRKRRQKQVFIDIVKPLHLAMDDVRSEYVSMFLRLYKDISSATTHDELLDAIKEFRANRDLVVTARSKIGALMSDSFIKDWKAIAIRRRSWQRTRAEPDITVLLDDFITSTSGFFGVRPGRRGTTLGRIAASTYSAMLDSDSEISWDLAHGRDRILRHLRYTIEYLQVCWSENSAAFARLEMCYA